MKKLDRRLEAEAEDKREAEDNLNAEVEEVKRDLEDRIHEVGLAGVQVGRLRLELAELRAELERQMELVKENSSDLKRSKEQLVKAETRVQELLLRLHVLEGEKAKAEDQEYQAELKPESQKCRMEEQLDIKCIEVGQLNEQTKAYALQLREITEQLREAGELLRETRQQLLDTRKQLREAREREGDMMALLAKA